MKIKNVAVVSVLVLVMVVCSNCATQKEQYIEEQYTEEQYTEQLRSNPENINAYLGRARLYNLSGKYEEAIKDFSEAIMLAPANYRLYHERGRSYAFLSLKCKDAGLVLIAAMYAIQRNEDWETALHLGRHDDRFMEEILRDIDKYLEQ